MNRNGIMIYRWSIWHLTNLVRDGYDIRTAESLERFHSTQMHAPHWGWKRGLEAEGFDVDYVTNPSFVVPRFLRRVSPVVYLLFLRAGAKFGPLQWLDRALFNLWVVLYVVVKRPEFLLNGTGTELANVVFWVCEKRGCATIEWYGDAPSNREAGRKRTAMEADYVLSGFDLDRLLPEIQDKFYRIEQGPTAEFADLVDQREEAIDVSIVGSYGSEIYSQRSELVEALLAGAPEEWTIEVFGNVYNDSLNDDFPHIKSALRDPVYGMEYNKVLAKSKMIINIPADQVIGIDNHRPKATFEAAASRTFQLAYETVGVKELFTPGTEIAVFDDSEELLAHVEEYLADERARRRVVENGYKRYEDQYTAEHQITRVFRRMGILS